MASAFFPLLPLLLWLAGAALGLLAAAVAGRSAAPPLRRASYGAAALGALATLAGAALSLATTPSSLAGAALSLAATTSSLAAPGGPPAAAALSPALPAEPASFASFALAIDPLGLFFALLLSVPALAAAVYGWGYLPGHAAPAGLSGSSASGHAGPAGHADPTERRPLAAGLLAAGFNLFLGALLLVFLAANVFTFLLVWEVMSLTSYFLVLYDHEEAAVRRVGYVYLVMTHAGTAFIMAAFLLLAALGAGSSAPGGAALSFDALRAAGHAPGATAWKGAVFALALIGFGTKAGLMPLHVWLPRAHPAAPTHVSALMSGVMVKTGIYGLLRVGWDWLGPLQSGAGSNPLLPAWTGWALLAVGLLSAVLGVLQALMERDLKRLLAFSTVENVGLVGIGLGASLLLAAAGHPAGAALALAAALTHAFNHALFKALLFLGAGAIFQGAHTRDLELLGGLIRRMPWTAAACFAGCLAIAGLPPLNGFTGEWLTLQSLLALGIAPGADGSVWLSSGALAAAALVGLTAALAAACFVKVFGTAFLALPRDPHAATATEVPASMRWAMGLLVAGCIAAGLWPALVWRAARPALALLSGGTDSSALGLAASPGALLAAGLLPAPATPLAGPAAPPILASLAVLAALAAGVALALALRRTLGGAVRVRHVPTWACGIVLAPRNEYTPASFSKPLRIIFAWAVQPLRHAEAEFAPDVAPYFVRAMSYHAGTVQVFEQALYRRAVALLLGASHRLRRLQTGSLRLYLAYLLAALVVMLIWGGSR